MIILEPVSFYRIWGTPRLHDYSGDSNIDKIGSVYTVLASKETSCIIKNGKYKNKSLYEVIKENPKIFGLLNNEDYPLIISMTAADENLSIQVHPYDQYATEKLGLPYGKSESWLFIQAPTSGYIYSGMSSIKFNGSNFEESLGKQDVSKGDLVYIEAGTLHALTAGSLVYEIQQATDITYRFYDYDRKDKDGKKRELHVKQATDTLIPSNKVNPYRFNAGKVYNQKPYSIQMSKGKMVHKNQSSIAESITVIDGILEAEQLSLSKGMSGLLLSGESIEIPEYVKVMIATAHPYWR